MPKTKLKPGIHLYSKKLYVRDSRMYWYWNIVSRNGRVIARSSETYTRKGNAKKSILVAAEIFLGGKPYELIPYYDHSKPDSTIQSYL
jgi:uncharacterized protein YegP (UPF0339 family)